MSVLSRLRSMDAEEIRFRLACEARKVAGLVRARLAPPQWRRADIARALSPAASSDAAPLVAARRALSTGNFSGAHLHLAAHFRERRPRFPMDPRTLPDLARRVRLRFPEAGADSRQRADRILAGRYTLLGYQDVPFGPAPRWHTDPVHGREAPHAYWSSIQYLNPEFGDHKIIWELNRHQHWLALGRAYHLTGDSRYFHAVVDQLESWMAANPPQYGVNWASMLELAFRLISWTWALHFFAAAADDSGEPPWIVDLLLGADCQLQHVEDNLSRYFSPNTHLLGEALALYVVSAAFPELRASGRRMALGRRVLLDELERQVNADGGHVELSAHYHRYTTDFYLLALLSARAVGDPAAEAFARGSDKLARFLRTIADDRGRLPLIGDDDGGQLFPVCGRPPSDCRDTLAAAAAILDDPALLASEIPEEVFWLCGMLPLESVAARQRAWPSSALPESGYYVSRTADGDHLVFDAGRHGFLNGGHAHADALSVVLTVGGTPLLVDSGTATYTMDPALRDRFRTTAMHNTVAVNGRSQSEPRGPFHWRTSIDARAAVWASHPAFDYAEGNHDGYAPIVHSRSVLAVHGFGWIVVDHLLGEGAATAEAFWHVHPDWIAVEDRGTVTLRHRTGSVLSIASSLPLEIVPSGAAGGLDAYAPIYGVVEQGICLRARSEGLVPRSFATFITCKGPAAQPQSEVEITPVTIRDAPPSGWHAAAFAVTCPGRSALLLTSVERRPPMAARGPAAMWGTATVHTDARVAFTYSDPTSSPPILLHGTRLRPAGLVRA